MILMQSPQVMLCKPSTNDRFDRRVIELAAFHHRMGHCNVPDVRLRRLMQPTAVPCMIDQAGAEELLD